MIKITGPITNNFMPFFQEYEELRQNSRVKMNNEYDSLDKDDML